MGERLKGLNLFNGWGVKTVEQWKSQTVVQLRGRTVEKVEPDERMDSWTVEQLNSGTVTGVNG